MPALATNEAAEKLAKIVETARPTILTEIYAEIYPEEPVPGDLSAADLTKLIRSGLEAEELVSLWNIVFPADRNVWYNEEDQSIHYNEESFGYADVD